MKMAPTLTFLATALLVGAACSSEERDSISSNAESAATQVNEALDEAGQDAAEAVARNVATQQGEEQFKNAGQELDGPLECEATVQDGLSKIDITCTGTTKAGGKAELKGTTNELPGESVNSLQGHFTGTVDGTEVFTTDDLGG
jgi:hypothetical protein